MQPIKKIQESTIKRFHIIGQITSGINVPPENKEFSHIKSTCTIRIQIIKICLEYIHPTFFFGGGGEISAVHGKLALEP